MREGTYCGLPIEYNEEDEFFNATKFCQRYGRDVNDIINERFDDEFIGAFKEHYDAMLWCYETDEGVFLHPNLKHHLAMCCDGHYMFMVCGLMNKIAGIE